MKCFAAARGMSIILVLCAGLLCWFRAAEPLLPETAVAGVRAEGRAQLDRVEQFASQPRYGQCWAEALRRVDLGCKDFNEETQSRIALAFAHCHLQRSARPFPLCSEGSSVQDCTRHMDSVAFNAYTEFFTHTHSICYFLQGEAWQLEAEDTVHRHGQKDRL
ncbi:GEX1 protein, partial [Polyodon spathula]|nr:GEX1 protein [Polyodon spathula]